MTTPEPAPAEDAVVQRFPPTNGRFTGILGVVTAAVVLAMALFARSTGTALGVAILAALTGVLAWATLLRPEVSVTSRDLVLRGMFHTDRIPLAAIEKVVIMQVLAVAAGGRRYVSPAIGHSAREVIKGRRRPGTNAVPDDAPADGKGAHQDFVESRITHLAAAERERLGIRPGSPEQAALAADVRRSWAWPELVAVGALVLAFVVWLVR